jgi:hypothetical protein
MEVKYCHYIFGYNFIKLMLIRCASIFKSSLTNKTNKAIKQGALSLQSAFYSDKKNDIFEDNQNIDETLKFKVKSDP